MRVLYFSRTYTTHDRRFLLKLAASRHEIWFLQLENDGIAYEKRPLPESIHPIEWMGGRQRCRTPEEWFRLMPHFESMLNQVQPQMIQAGPIQSCGLLTALSGFRPFIAVSWGSDILVDADQDDFWTWMTKYTLGRSDRLLCDSQAVREKVQQLVQYPDDRIIQFPWGIDLNVFRPGNDPLQLRQQLGWKSAIVVLSTRAWEKIYGIDILLEAFALAYTLDPRLRLLLLGGGSLAADVHHQIADKRLQDVVYCPGLIAHDQLPGYFRAADVYMSCTYSDGTSISLLEALATGLPVVVTDAPGNREWVAAGGNGWLAAAGQPYAFAKALETATSLAPAERSQMILRNRCLTEERADWDINFAKLLTAYASIESEFNL